MNNNCSRDIDNAKSLNEMFQAINKHYNLDKQFSTMEGLFVKNHVKKNMATVIEKLRIPPRQKFTI